VNKHLRLLPVLALLAGPSCFTTSKPVVYHALRAVAPAAAPTGASVRALAVEIMPVRLPEILQRPQLVTTQGPGALELAPGHRWANALDRDMQLVLAQDLAALLGTDRVVAYPYGPQVDATYRVAVDVQRCDGHPGGVLVFQATWMISAPKDIKALVVRKTTLELPVAQSTDALVAAHEQALAALGKDIADWLRAQP
jgi:uncharacterized protein